MDYGRPLFTCALLSMLSLPACELVVDFDRDKLDAASGQRPTPVPSADDGAMPLEPDAALTDGGALVQPEPADAGAPDAEASAPDASDGDVPDSPDASADTGVGFTDAAPASDADTLDGFVDAEPLDALVDGAEPADALVQDAEGSADAGESDAGVEDAAVPEPGLDGGI